MSNVTKINDWCHRINTAWRKSVAAFVEAGGLLAEAKTTLPHGQFEKMIETKLDFGASTARKLMAIARNQALANRSNWNVLPPSLSALFALSQLPGKFIEGKIESESITPEMPASVAEYWVIELRHAQEKPIKPINVISIRATTQRKTIRSIAYVRPAPAEDDGRLKPDTSRPSAEVPPELEQISHLPEADLDRYAILVAAWQAASPEERTRFLNHVGIASAA